MIKTLIKIGGILLLVILQLTFFSKFSIYGSIPNFIFIFSIIFLLRGFLKESLMMAAIGGLFLDLVSTLRFGWYTFLLLIAIVFIYFVVLKILPSSSPIWVGTIFVGVFLFINSVIFLVNHLPIWQIFLDVLINSIWGLLTYLLFLRFVKVREIQFV